MKKMNIPLFARKGAKLDTIADIVFVIACLVKLLPVLVIPVWLWVWIGIIALIKIAEAGMENYITHAYCLVGE